MSCNNPYKYNSLYTKLFKRARHVDVCERCFLCFRDLITFLTDYIAGFFSFLFVYALLNVVFCLWAFLITV